MSLHKTYDIASFKALGDSGRFEAIVSVFGNVDLQGDRVIKGAFKKSLQKLRTEGNPIPIIWSHDWGDPFAHIGYADPRLAEEVDSGLKLVGQLDVDKPFAAQVFDLLKTRRVREWSFAYDVIKEKPADDRANELLELDLIEAGPTLKGANPETQTLAVKAVLETAAAKAGRTLSTKNEAALRQAYEIIGTVLSSVAKQEPEEEKAEEPGAMPDGAYVPFIDRKTDGKPWHIEEHDGQFCVMADEDGESMGCHDTREEAEAHMRALYASEKADPHAELRLRFEALVADI